MVPEIVLSSLFKLLLFPAYHSTDFDVHRNWLAITHNLPLREWYFENTSEWTLDYPPFFAFFEYLLSFSVPKSAVEDGCLNIVAEDGMYGWPTIVFQRSSVLFTELCLIYALTTLMGAGVRFPKLISVLIYLCPAWVVLDHIHFQYNGAMYGLLLISITYMQKQKYLKSAFLFAVLLCFKHLYLYVAPAYFAYLLRNYALRSFKNLLKLGLVTLSPFLLAFGPFYWTSGVDGLIQIKERLFPFARGLTHSYWAPNFWAVYTFGDRVMGIIYRNSTVSSTRGIVGQVEFSNFMEITAKTTFIISTIFQLIAMIFVSGRSQFVECVTLCAFSSFLFGYHVHEKAVLTVIVPLALICTKRRSYMNAFIVLVSAGCCGLLPLIFTPAEFILKYCCTLAYLTMVAFVVPSYTGYSLSWISKLYLLGLLLLIPGSELLPFVTYLSRYSFAKNMLVSVYCSLGVLLSFIQVLLASLFEKESAQEYETVVKIEVEDDKVEFKIIE
ncbi:dolichyl-P-Glc:Glc1Man(9)GlcNAc(2)-PP-dolichol alpha-1,3-glucosyltransferase [Starmerella bacillaris]|uniref:Alpha-1,3-glucosyltransferase n=1 Tax=Starmerella bacillaris TaxID=1247836 RepID=A0AAV5RD98_STABA|nr:dolichyl-P-Glc:Glc1Man(9)GlcNAc(2)-PP-dolichol alpha-1,3-glucosyltransferase [Starmerella bacillaris]